MAAPTRLACGVRRRSGGGAHGGWRRSIDEQEEAIGPVLRDRHGGAVAGDQRGERANVAVVGAGGAAVEPREREQVGAVGTRVDARRQQPDHFVVPRGVDPAP